MAKEKVKKNTGKVSSKDFNLTTKDGVAMEIPEEGSLGLIGLGHIGLFAWRSKRKELGVFPFDKETQEKLVKSNEKRKEKIKNSAEK